MKMNIIISEKLCEIFLLQLFEGCHKVRSTPSLAITSINLKKSWNNKEQYGWGGGSVSYPLPSEKKRCVRCRVEGEWGNFLFPCCLVLFFIGNASGIQWITFFSNFKTYSNSNALARILGGGVINRKYCPPPSPLY